MTTKELEALIVELALLDFEEEEARKRSTEDTNSTNEDSLKKQCSETKDVLWDD